MNQKTKHKLWIVGWIVFVVLLVLFLNIKYSYSNKFKPFPERRERLQSIEIEYLNHHQVKLFMFEAENNPMETKRMNTERKLKKVNRFIREHRTVKIHTRYDKNGYLSTVEVWYLIR